MSNLISINCYGPEASIFYGGHYYSSRRKSLVGILVSLFLQRLMEWVRGDR